MSKTSKITKLAQAADTLMSAYVYITHSREHINSMTCARENACDTLRVLSHAHDDVLREIALQALSEKRATLRERDECTVYYAAIAERYDYDALTVCRQREVSAARERIALRA